MRVFSIDMVYLTQVFDKDQFILYLEFDRKLSKSTISNTLSNVHTLLSFLSENNLTLNRTSMNLLLQYLKSKGKKNTYLNQFVKLSKHLDRFLKQKEFEDYQYFQKEKKIIDVITPSEIRKLAELRVSYRYEKKMMNLTWKALIYLLATTGVRITEALSLTASNVTERYIHIEHSKNYEARLVPLSKMLYALLCELPHKQGVLFRAYTGKPLTGVDVNWELKRRAGLIGLKKPLYNHIFRHSFITELYKHGIEAPTIARIVGHKSLESTNHYIHPELSDLEFAIKHHPLLSGEVTFDSIKIKLKEAVEKYTKNKKFPVSMEESRDTILIKVSRA